MSDEEPAINFSIRPVQFGNCSILNPAIDMGKDGNGFSTTFGRVGRDVYGFGLGYYNNDYIPVGGSGASLGLSYSFGTPNSATTGSALYNGNISHTTLALNKFDTGNVAGYTYAYDQLNRLIKMNRHTPTPGAATWSNGSIIDAYKEQVSYDANGNILTYLRNGNSGSISMDNLTYKYSQGNNRLDHVNDAVSATAYVVDIDNQDTLNYRYDNIGNLKKDAAEGIDSINWTVYGKIASIDKSKNIDGTVHHTRLDYTYDPAGNRVTKSFVESAGGTDGPLLTTYYARDAQGNVMGVYIDSGGVYAENKPIYWSEQHLYGSSRLGIWQQNKTIPLSLFLPEGNTQDSIMYGSTSYELTNHLGNVLATISDKKLGHALNDTTIDYFNADVVTANDYYPGGMLMPERSYSQSTSKYRYGFNGKENDNEVKGEDNQQDYGMRIYDPRLVRFLSIDPIAKSYPELTPYQFASNNPIALIDIDGLEGKKPKLIGNTSAKLVFPTSTEIENHINTINVTGIPRSYLKDLIKGEGLSLSMYDIDQNDRTTERSHGGNATIGIGHLVHLGAIGSNQYDKNALSEEQPFSNSLSIDEVFNLFGNDVQIRVNEVTRNLQKKQLKDVNENTKAVFVDLRYNAPSTEDPAENIYKKGAKYGGSIGGDAALYNAIDNGTIRSISNARKKARLNSIEKSTLKDVQKSRVADDPRENKPAAQKKETDSA